MNKETNVNFFVCNACASEDFPNHKCKVELPCNIAKPKKCLFYEDTKIKSDWKLEQ